MRAFSLVVMLILSGSCFAQAELKVEVILNQPDAGGKLQLALCPSAETYKSEKGCVMKSVEADARTVSCTFTGVSPGTYAVSVFHDVNGNGELDKSWVGWPKEPWGFSNDAPVNTGIPPFKLAAFEVKEGKQTERIRLQ
ncbi:MAG: DUF2141 domain-containing protein [Flavobacteriales bacterium]|jgi:uncharacterized protein (DUF2141 family)|nr:DUF2141 domain-containing protein [Flavobacteriales bacterium]MCB0759687.1 DUF2141 domain-containing protein [Flavobacteriales bacterium]